MSLHTAVLDQYQVALERKNGGDEKSYTVYLYQAGLDKILKKCGEETVEAVIAAKNDDALETLGELNDVLYHVTVLLCHLNVTMEQVLERLNLRCQSEGKTLDELFQVIQGRRETEDQESYTYYLFQKGLDKILKKVGEAVSLLLIAAKGNDLSGVAEETADLLYHLMVMMVAKNLTPADLEGELDRRNQKTGNLKTFHVSDHTT
jgi:phosphoribosyl-ATP pyrophosphohydrolase